MYNREDKLKAATAASQVDRRGSNRHPYIAAADVVEVGSGDTLVPFGAGSKVRVTIREGQTQFQATGIVVYSQSGLGMGIAFDEMKPEQRKTLAVWLGEEVSQRDETYEATPAAPRAMLPHGSDREALVRLVRVMVNKGLLSEAEGTTIFGNPVLF
jgi:hypothetical protein